MDIRTFTRAWGDIENELEVNWGGRGCGMNQKLISAIYPVPSVIVKSIRYVATMRNKIVHDGLEIPDSEAYLDVARRAYADLQQALPEAKVQHRRRLRVRLMLGGGFALVIAAVAAIALWTSREAQDASPTMAATGNTTQLFLASKQTASADDPQLAATRVAFQAGRSVALSGPQIPIDNVSVKLTRDSFGANYPEITLDVRNDTAGTISHVNVEALLVLRDATGKPDVIVALEEHDSRARALFAWFGEMGLASGQKRTVVITPGRLGSPWRSPDALAAVSSGRAQVVLRAVDYGDGRKATHKLDVPSPPEVLRLPAAQAQ